MSKLVKGLIWFGIAVLGAWSFASIATHRDETISAIWFVLAAACVYLIAYRFYAGDRRHRRPAPGAGDQPEGRLDRARRIHGARRTRRLKSPRLRHRRGRGRGRRGWWASRRGLFGVDDAVAVVVDAVAADLAAPGLTAGLASSQSLHHAKPSPSPSLASPLPSSQSTNFAT